MVRVATQHKQHSGVPFAVVVVGVVVGVVVVALLSVPWNINKTWTTMGMERIFFVVLI
jgi:hypothetical protein